jgi:hypothetical protein
MTDNIPENPLPAPPPLSRKERKKLRNKKNSEETNAIPEDKSVETEVENDTEVFTKSMIIVFAVLLTTRDVVLEYPLSKAVEIFGQ